MRFFFTSLLSVFILTNYFSIQASAQSFPDSERELDWKDLHVKPVLKRATDQTSLFLVIGGAASVAVTNRQDDHIQGQWMGYQKMSEGTAQVGDIMGSGLVGLTILAAQYGYDKNQDHWMSHGRALVYSTAASSTMKLIFGRQRPGNSPNHHSFPSGHTTTAFATATALTYSYGWKAAAVAYPLAVFVGLSRLTDNVHWGSDVVGGAFAGFWTARASSYSLEEVRSEYAQQNSVRTQWVPVVSHDYLGFQVSSSF